MASETLLRTTASSTMSGTVPAFSAAANENAAPAEASASAAPLKAYVPSRDRRLALSAIDGELNAAKAAWREKHGGGGAPSGKEEFLLKCIDQTGASLRRQLEASTVAAEEVPGEEALDAYQTELLRLASPSTDREGDDESLSSVDDEDEDIEFDDSEILDQEAYDQAKHLRGRAREVAARVISLREEASGKALEISRRDLAELLKVHGFSENEEEANENGDQTEEGGEEARDPSSSMQVALQTLASSLQNVDSGLVDKLESLKETIGTIDSTVEKYQRASQGDASALSQTEKALLASDAPMETRVESQEEESDSPMDPNKKLARLLAGIL